MIQDLKLCIKSLYGLIICDRTVARRWNGPQKVTNIVQRVRLNDIWRAFSRYIFIINTRRPDNRCKRINDLLREQPSSGFVFKNLNQLGTPMDEVYQYVSLYGLIKHQRGKVCMDYNTNSFSRERCDHWADRSSDWHYWIGKWLTGTTKHVCRRT